MMKTAGQMVWDCRQAQEQIALTAGGDGIDAATGELLAAHLVECPQCRKFEIQMSSSLEALQSCAADSLPPHYVTRVWSGVAARLPVSSPRSALASFNLWVPTSAMAAACAAMILVAVIQLEQVAPFQPVITPHLQTAISGQSTRDLFQDRPLDDRRPTGPRTLSVPHAVPVNLPANVQW